MPGVRYDHRHFSASADKLLPPSWKVSKFFTSFNLCSFSSSFSSASLCFLTFSKACISFAANSAGFVGIISAGGRKVLCKKKKKKSGCYNNNKHRQAICLYKRRPRWYKVAKSQQPIRICFSVVRWQTQIWQFAIGYCILKIWSLPCISLLNMPTIGLFRNTVQKWSVSTLSQVICKPRSGGRKTNSDYCHGLLHPALGLIKLGNFFFRLDSF